MPKEGMFVKEGGTPGAAAAALGAAAVAAAVASGVFQEAWGSMRFGRAPGAEALVLAAAVAAVAALSLRRGRWRWWMRPDFVLAWSATAFGILAAWVMATQHTGRVDGRWCSWLEDDPMVSFQYARHLASGAGLVWTRGQRVEGFSNPLWTLLMAAVLALKIPRAAAPAVMLAINLALGLAALPAVARLARALGAAPSAAAWAAAGLGLSYEWVWAAASGMETTALACLCAWAFAGIAEARAAGRPVPGWVPALAGAAALLRFDGALPAGIIVGATLAVEGPRRWKDALWVAVPLAGWQVLRLAYFHAWIPNTVLLKMGPWPGRWRAGCLYDLRLDFQSRLALLAALSSLAWRRLRPWGLVFVAVLLYGCATAGDFYPGTRYLAWGWPLLWALAAAALCAWIRRPGLAAAAMALAALWSYQAFWAFPGLMRGGWRAGAERVAVARLMDAVVPPGQRVASDWAGTFYYYSDVQGEDLLGKCDPVVAAARPDPGLGPTAHDKMDLAYSLGEVRPDWVLLVPPGQDPGLRWLHTAYDARIWNDPLFAAHCRASARLVGGHWALCRCRWGDPRGGSHPHPR